MLYYIHHISYIIYNMIFMIFPYIPHFQTHLFHWGSDTSVCFRLCTAPCRTTVCCFWPEQLDPHGADKTCGTTSVCAWLHWLRPLRRRWVRRKDTLADFVPPPETTIIWDMLQCCSHFFGAGTVVGIISSDLLPLRGCQKLGYPKQIHDWIVNVFIQAVINWVTAQRICCQIQNAKVAPWRSRSNVPLQATEQQFEAKSLHLFGSSFWAIQSSDSAA